MHMLALAFAVRLYDKYPFHMGLLVWLARGMKEIHNVSQENCHHA